MTPGSTSLERFSRSDWRLLLFCGFAVAACLVFSLSFFDRAFPEASIEFRYDRGTSEPLAAEVLDKTGFSPEGWTHAARFDVDHSAKIFLERSVGLQSANQLMGDEVEVWYWTHRWFRPLETEEVVVRISPRGEVVAFEHRVEEARSAPAVDPAERAQIGTEFLESIGIDTSSLELVSISDTTLPARVDSVLVWEHRTVRPADAAYRFEVTLHGSEVGGFKQSLEVPERWRREYQSLRSQNEAAGDVASILFTITSIAALFVYVIRIRRRDIQIRFSGWVGGVCAVLVTLVSLNGLPSALADYDTRTSFSSFLFQEIGFALFAGVSLGLFLMVMVGTGDALLRERLPDKLAMPLLLSRRAFRSKRVFTGSVLGFTLVAGFLAYQVGFYLIADKLGAWAPAEIPYDSTLNTWFPWVVVLFGGFFPAFSEEYISRAFSIPFLERLLRSRFAAIAISAFIWGFGHSAYPNQPFFIRGLEVGIAGIALGYVVYRFGILPALVWHYTVDAIYTSLLLIQSGNTYYMVSSAICAFVFAIPLIVSIALYLRHGGFEPDGELENRVIGTAASPVEDVPQIDTTPPPVPDKSKWVIVTGVTAAAVALVLALSLPPKLDSLADYPMTPDDAIELATEHLGLDEEARPGKVVVWPSAGFRRWNTEAERGGAPGSYDLVAAEHIAKNSEGPYATLRRIMSEDVEAATWKVRFFDPGVTEEYLFEIDPRARRVVGMTHTIEEKEMGATLEREPAAAIASIAMRRYGHDPDDYTLKDSIAIPLPNRRDWTFHFERGDALADEAWARVDVRLAGNRVTHLGETVRVPESVRRDASERRFFNTLLLFAQIAAVIFILVIGGVGVVTQARESRLEWKPALRLTVMLIIPAAVAGFLPAGLASRDYPTSISWDTFIAREMLFTAQGVAFQLFILFLSLTAISACLPWSTRILTPAGRGTFGSDAVIRGLAAAAIFSSVFLLGDAMELWSGVGLDLFSPVSDRAAIPFPALQTAWQAIATAGWIAALAVAVRACVTKIESIRKRRAVEAAIILALALFLSDVGARIQDLPVVLVQSLATAVVLYGVARLLFAPNPLSVPLTILLLVSVDDIASWVRSGRSDLQNNAIILATFVLAVYLWTLSGRGSRSRGVVES